MFFLFSRNTQETVQTTLATGVPLGVSWKAHVGCRPGPRGAFCARLRVDTRLPILAVFSSTLFDGERDRTANGRGRARSEDRNHRRASLLVIFEVRFWLFWKRPCRFSGGGDGEPQPRPVVTSPCPRARAMGGTRTGSPPGTHRTRVVPGTALPPAARVAPPLQGEKRRHESTR